MAIIVPDKSYQNDAQAAAKAILISNNYYAVEINENAEKISWETDRLVNYRLLEPTADLRYKDGNVEKTAKAEFLLYMWALSVYPPSRCVSDPMLAPSVCRAKDEKWKSVTSTGWVENTCLFRGQIKCTYGSKPFCKFIHCALQEANPAGYSIANAHLQTFSLEPITGSPSKLYGIIESDFETGDALDIYIYPRWGNFSKSRNIELSEIDQFGGPDISLGSLFIGSGIICLLLSLIFSILTSITKRTSGNIKHVVDIKKKNE